MKAKRALFQKFYRDSHSKRMINIYFCNLFSFACFRVTILIWPRESKYLKLQKLTNSIDQVYIFFW